MLCRQKFFALDPRIYRSLKVWIGLKKRLPSYKLAATIFGGVLSTTQCARDEGYLCQELEWVHMEDHQPGSAATTLGEMGAGDTISIGRREPSSFVAAGDRLLVHLHSSYSTACPGDTPTTLKSSNVPVEESERWGKIPLTGKLEFKTWPNWEYFWICRMNFRSGVSSGASRPIGAMTWINNMGSAKYVAELKTSNSITGADVQTNLQVLGSKIASDLGKPSTETLKKCLHRRRSCTEGKRYLKGRQVAWMIYEFFKVCDTDECLLDLIDDIQGRIEKTTTCSRSTRDWRKPSSR